MFNYGELTKLGNRSVQEDRLAAASAGSKQLYIICDGLGGHRGGAEAAELARDTFVEILTDQGTVEDYLHRAFGLAQERILQKQAECPELARMKTTVAALVLEHDMAWVGYIGDSRVYLFRNSGNHHRTRDHTVAQALVNAGELKEAELREHPDRNRLLRSMGSSWQSPRYVLEKPVPLGDIRAILLCTDGFWSEIREERMTALLDGTDSGQAWLDAMYAEFTPAADRDNHSAIALLKK